MPAAMPSPTASPAAKPARNPATLPMRNVPAAVSVMLADDTAQLTAVRDDVGGFRA